MGRPVLYGHCDDVVAAVGVVAAILGRVFLLCAVCAVYITRMTGLSLRMIPHSLRGGRESGPVLPCRHVVFLNPGRWRRKSSRRRSVLRRPTSSALAVTVPGGTGGARRPTPPVLSAAAVTQKPSVAHPAWDPAVGVIQAVPVQSQSPGAWAPGCPRHGASVVVLATFRAEGVANALAGGTAAATAASPGGLAITTVDAIGASDRGFDAWRHAPRCFSAPHFERRCSRPSRSRHFPTRLWLSNIRRECAQQQMISD